MRGHSFSLALAVCCCAGSVPCAMAIEPAVYKPSQVIEIEPKNRPEKPPVITAVAIAPGGKQVATAGDDHLVRIWSTSTGRVQHTLQGHADWIRSLVFSPDGKTLASAGDDRRIRIWNTNSGKLASTIPIEQHAIYSLAYHPSGETLAAVGFGHTVCLHDVRSGKELKSLYGPGVDLRSVVFSPDGSQLAVAGRNGQIHIWSMPAGTVQLEISAAMGRIRAIAFLPEGDKLVSADESRQVTLWDVSTGQEVYKFTCNTAKIMSLAVCSDHLIATGGSDNVVHIWNWQNQSEANRLVGHTGSVAALAFDKDSNKIISGSFDTTVRVWNLPPASGGTDTAQDPAVPSRVR